MVLVVVMGVSGSGKSTVGTLLADKLGWKFYEGDDYHPEENRKKMAEGIPLTDQDRIPWLCHLHDILMREHASGQSVILACSALKKNVSVHFGERRGWLSEFEQSTRRKRVCSKEDPFCPPGRANRAHCQPSRKKKGTFHATESTPISV